MTDLSAEQNAMLERLAFAYSVEDGPSRFLTIQTAVAALRKLLLAVQERDAEHIKGRCTAQAAPCRNCCNIANAILEQAYADLFLKEE